MKTTKEIQLEEKVKYYKSELKQTKVEYNFWFDAFNERYPDEVVEILDSEEYAKR